MAVPTDISDLSTTAASNSPAGTDSIGTSLDDFLRTIQAIQKQMESEGSAIASATTITIPDDGIYFSVTGTTTITGINDAWDGRNVLLHFAGACQLTHSAGLVLDSGSTYTTAANDVFLAVNTAAGVWYLFHLNASVAKLNVAQSWTAVQTFGEGVNEDYTTFTSSSNASTITCTDGNNFGHTLTENTTITFSTPPSTGTAYGMTVKIIQDSGGSGYTVTWPTSVDWPVATAPTLTSDANAVDWFVFITHDGGTTWYGFVAGQAMG